MTTDVSTSPAAPVRDVDTSGVDDATRSALRLLAAGVTELVGFDVAAVSIAVEDQLEVVAVSGSDDARAALIGSRTATALTEELVGLADDWGVLRFVPHDRAADYLSRHGWTPQYQPRADVPDAWHAEDMLFAPFLGPHGLEGLLAVDLPSDGRRPDLAKRHQLEAYAVQAGRAIHLAVERARLTEHLQLASRARLAVREAARDLSLDGLLAQVETDLVAGFRAAKLWIQVHGHTGEGGVLWDHGPRPLGAVPPLVARIIAATAERAWTSRRTAAISDARIEAGIDADLWGTDDPEQLRALMVALRVGSVLVVPVSDGRTWLGHLCLARAAGEPDWSEHDVEVASEVGIDLGHAVAHARAFEREQALVRELQALDDHKSELVATLSHELKTPLASILGNLELLRDVGEVPDDAMRGLAAIERGARRLTRVVEDLMLLAKLGDPGNPLICRPVDLGAVVREVVALTDATVRQRRLAVRLHLAEGVQAWGDPDQLDRVVTNLVSNAAKYTDEGGCIELAVHRRGADVVLTCTDDGIGISPGDQGRLFREFFRSTNPQALGVPGTGLGLAIVERIVRRHGGRVGVRSALGSGSTFEVALPAADQHGPAEA